MGVPVTAKFTQGNLAQIFQIKQKEGINFELGQ